LFALLQTDSPENSTVCDFGDRPDIQELIASDVDNGGHISTSWREKLTGMNIAS
jgi:hypothetical protein